MKKQSRGQFLRNVTLASAGAGLMISGCRDRVMDQTSAPNIISKKTYRWRMVTTWPPNFPILGEGCQLFADLVEQWSNGRLQIKVYGGGELIPALQAFDAVSSGTVEMGNGAAYYWAGKSPATQFFASLPFGMNAQQMNAWLIAGGGQQLWDELYGQFNLIPLNGGNTGVQMGGWYNREINSITDFNGLKMRMPGLGGQVLNKAGGTAILVAGGEIYTNLERGVIDATEWIGPYHDYIMGFPKIAKYYYAPGWHETGTILEYFINRSKYDSLPVDLQGILRAASQYLNSWILATFEAKNAEYLQKIQNEKVVDIRRFSPEILSRLRTFAQEVIAEVAEKDAFSKRVYESYTSFQKTIQPWANLTEKAYYDEVM